MAVGNVSREKVFAHLRERLATYENAIRSDTGLTEECRRSLHDQVDATFRRHHDLLSRADGMTLEEMRSDAARKGAALRASGQRTALGLGAVSLSLIAASLGFGFAGYPTMTAVLAGISIPLSFVGGMFANAKVNRAELHDQVARELERWGGVIAPREEPPEAKPAA